MNYLTEFEDLSSDNFTRGAIFLLKRNSLKNDWTRSIAAQTRTFFYPFFLLFFLINLAEGKRNFFVYHLNEGLMPCEMRRRKLSRDFARFFLLIRFSLNSPLRFRTVDRVIRQETSLGIFFKDQKKKKKKVSFRPSNYRESISLLCLVDRKCSWKGKVPEYP